MNIDVNPAAHSALPEAPRNALPEAPPVHRAEHRESSLTLVIEQQTAKIPSHLFLSASLAAMVVSATLRWRGKAEASRFIGSWAAPLLVMGVYNKLVKTVGTR